MPKEKLKELLDKSLYYILLDSPLKSYHVEIYNKAVKSFNNKLARDSK